MRLPVSPCGFAAWCSCLGLSGLLLLVTGCGPDTPAEISTFPPSLFERVEEYRLDNGMLFLLLPRRDVPMVSGNIMVKVGNVDNPAGATGLAHMFEHMAFKGTAGIGSTDPEAEAAVLDSLAAAGERLASARRDPEATPDLLAVLEDEVRALEKRATGHTKPMAFPLVYEGYTFDFNAYTSQDVTAYTATLPANNLEAWMLMESERLQHPVFREFYSELDVVMEERRQSTEDEPNSKAWELLKSLAFTQHPYRYPTIGYMEDLQTLTPGMLHAFQEQYYAPGNMVGVLVGDFDPDDAPALIDAYFGDIPAGPAPPAITVTEPEPREQRRAVHRQGQERRLLMAFPGFGPDDTQRPTADLLASVLSRDRTSRLDQRLDLQEGVARAIAVRSNGWVDRFQGMFIIRVDLMPEHTNEQAEALVWEELQRLISEPVSMRRLNEIRASYRKRFVFGLQKNKDLANLLALWQTTAGDWRRCYQRYAAYDKVTPEDISRMAAQLFKPQRSTVVYLEPAADAQVDEKREGGQP